MGVGFLGDSGPKAPIVLGTNNFSLSKNQIINHLDQPGDRRTLFAELYHVVETLDVDSDRQGDVVLAHGGEEGGEVDEPVYPLVHNDLLQTLKVQDVGEHEGALGELLVPGLDDVGEDDAVLAVQRAQLPREAGAELAEAACDEDARRLGGGGQRPGRGQDLTLKMFVLYDASRRGMCDVKCVNSSKLRK